MGNGPPYTAVITLSAMAALHWRAIRVRFLNDGIADPMALTSLHTLLDLVEAVVLEAVVSQAKKPEEAKSKRTRFLDQLYAPVAEEAKVLNGSGYKPPPSGFEAPEAVEAGFNAFAGMLGGGG